MEYNLKHDLTPQQIEAMTVIKEIRVYKNGLEIVRGMRFPTPRPTPPQNRGIYEMSRKSKMRMAHIVANSEVKWVSMITLTYGDFFIPIDGKELKRQLNIFLKYFRNRFDGEYFWFLEFTKKERPHVHIITTMEPNILDRVWLADKWAKISVVDVYKDLRTVGVAGLPPGWSKIPEEVMEKERRKVAAVHRHKKAWDKIHKTDGAIRYMLKYASKQEQKLVPTQFGNVGRFWGTTRAVEAHLEMTLKVGEDISQEQLQEIFDKALPPDLPMIPRFFFLTDVISKLEKVGVSLKQLNEDFNKQKSGKPQQNMVDSE